MVGETGWVPPSGGISVKKETSETVLKFGEGGVLVRPSNDMRHWFWKTVYAGGVLEISASSDVNTSRKVLSHRQGCATARYRLLSGLPWDKVSNDIKTVRVAEDMGGFERVNMCYWFYTCTNIIRFERLRHLLGLHDMNFCFASCQSIETIDPRGFDSSHLNGLDYAFSGCNELMVIMTDASWKLPETVKGFRTFYNSKLLVGGTNAKWNDSRVGGKFLHIDSGVTSSGYLTTR